MRTMIAISITILSRFFFLKKTNISFLNRIAIKKTLRKETNIYNKIIPIPNSEKKLFLNITL
jgi:hypothetical protein